MEEGEIELELWQDRERDTAINEGHCDGDNTHEALMWWYTAFVRDICTVEIRVDFMPLLVEVLQLRHESKPPSPGMLDLCNVRLST